MECKKCIICYTTTAFVDVGCNGSSRTKLQLSKDPVLNRQLIVIFVLREFFEIPKEVCLQLLKYRGNPSEWIVWCESCSFLVKKAKDVFDQINLLRKQFGVLKEELKTAVRLSELKFREKYVDRSDSRWDATKIIRDCFGKKEYDLGQHLEDWSIQCKIEDVEERMNNSEDESPVFLKDEIDPLDLGSGNSELFSEIKIERDSFGSSDTESEETPDSMKKRNKPQRCSARSKARNKPKLSNETRFACQMCSHFSTNKSNLKIHYTKVHGRFPFSCEKCEIQLVDEQDLEKHNYKHHAETIPCPKCNKTYIGKYGLQEHCKKRHPNEYDEMFFVTKRKRRQPTAEESIPCGKCGKMFMHLNNLKLHYKKCHPGDYSEMFENISNTCLKCKEKFDTRVDLKSHIQKEHPKLFKLIYFHGKIRLHSCPYCPFKTPKPYLQDHINIHLNLRPYNCDICGKSFKNSKVLKYHQRSEHYEQLGINPIKCEHCGKMFKTPSYLQTHIKSVHLGQFKHFCPVCNRGFTHPSYLEIHLQRHNGEKPKLCEECGKSFLTSTSLKSHIRRIHAKEKPHHCKKCDKKFSDSNHLRRHENAVHSEGNNPHECQICHKKFPIRNYLYIHMRSHKKKGEVLEVENGRTSL